MPLTERAAAVLLRPLETAEGDFLFPGRGTDQPIIKVNRAHVGHSRSFIGFVKKQTRVRSTLSPLRFPAHLATRGAMAGIDLVTLAAMLGYSRIQMVLRDAHPTEEHQFAAMKKLEAFRMVRS